MDHFAPGDWIDFVRGFLNPSTSAPMQAHLDQDCEECRQASGIWRDVVGIAQRETGFEPPVTVVSGLKAAFVPAKPWGWLTEMAQYAQLVFDSFRQPAYTMVRGSAPVSRQLVHEAEPFTIDLRLEADPLRKRVSLTGQIVNSKNPERETPDIDVVLLSGPNLVKKTLANASGEFDLDFESDPDLQLFINIRGQRAVGIVLPGLET
jgi:hypothetical protein